MHCCVILDGRTSPDVLLANGARRCRRLISNRKTPLHLAAWRGSAALVKRRRSRMAARVDVQAGTGEILLLFAIHSLVRQSPDGIPAALSCCAGDAHPAWRQCQRADGPEGGLWAGRGGVGA